MTIIQAKPQARIYPTKLNPNLYVIQSGQTIQSVIDSITDANASNPYIVMVPPGVYSGHITMAPYIHITGFGDSTIVQHDGSSTISTVQSPCFSSISSIKIICTGTGENDRAIGYEAIHNNGIFISNCSIEALNCWAIKVERTDKCFWGSIQNVRIKASSGIMLPMNCWMPIIGTKIQLVGQNQERSHIGILVSGSLSEIYINDCYIFSRPSTMAESGEYITGAIDHVIGISTENNHSKVVTILNTKISIQNELAADVICLKADNSTGGTIEAYNCVLSSVCTADASKAIDAAQNNNGIIELYNCIYSTSSGAIAGTQCQQGKLVALTAHGTFSPEDGNIFKLAGNAAYNFNPSGTFAPWTQITIINADASDTFTFDSAGLNQAITSGQRGIFIYDGSGWLKIYVGS